MSCNSRGALDGRRTSTRARWALHALLLLSAFAFAASAVARPIVGVDSVRLSTGDRPDWADPSLEDASWPLVAITSAWSCDVNVRARACGVCIASTASVSASSTSSRCSAERVATAKRDLAVGETLDGEGGYTVWGKLLPVQRSLAFGGLPLGLAHDVKLVRPVKAGQSLSWDDVVLDQTTPAFQLRRELESLFAR